MSLTESNPVKGIMLSLAAYLFLALIGVFEKSISPGISVPVILLFQNGVCFLLVLFNIRRQNTEFFKTQVPATYVIRIVSGLGCYAALFYIIRFMPISEAIIYQYSATLWIPFIMFFWLGVRMNRQLWWGILVGFAGILLILKPTSSMLLSVISVFGILCGVLQGVSVVAIRKLSMTEPTERIMFYNFLVATVITACFAARQSVVLSWHDALLLIGVGVSTYVGQRLVTVSLRYAHPSTLAPTSYTNILYSGVLGWMIWSETPEASILTGMFLVVVGCLLTLWVTRVVTAAPTPVAELR